MLKIIKNKTYWTPIITGVLVMVFFVLYQIFSPIKGDTGRLVQGGLSLLLRVFVVYWINQIAKEQGRKALFFVILGIIIPAITLIIIGVLGKKKDAEKMKLE